MPAAESACMALGPMFPVIRAVTSSPATAWATCNPVPPEDPALELRIDSAVIPSVSTTVKKGQRPNLGSNGASRSDAPAVTHIFIKRLYIIENNYASMRLYI
jgi:hypothetical protein